MSQDSGPEQMRPEYDFSGGVRGKYFERYWKGRVTVNDESLVVQVNNGGVPELCSAEVTWSELYLAPQPSAIPEPQVGKVDQQVAASAQ